MTKKLAHITLLLLVVVSTLTGCAESNSSSYSETVDLKEIYASDLSELKQETKELSNLSISDDAIVIVPDASNIYEYTTSLPQEIDMTEYDSEFRQMFEYLFTDHNINEDYLLYMGGSSRLDYDDNGNIITNYNHVNEWKDSIISGKEGRVSYLYDETWNMDKTIWNNEICFEIGNPIGYGYAVVNKGVTVKECEHKVYDDKLAQERYPILESYDPSDWLEYIATYSPDSTESYPLLNGEISISKAVEFFEKYINSIPYPSDPNTKTRVVEVEVYKISSSVYGYYFLTTMEFQGLYFDHMRSGVEHSEFNDYISIGGNAFMALTDDVDVIYGYYRKQNINSVASFKKIIPIQKALQSISGSLSNAVVFDLKRIELVYTQKPSKDKNGYIALENNDIFVSPAWKISLYNPNDNYDYICYVDAKDGNNFRYYKTPAN